MSRYEHIIPELICPNPTPTISLLLQTYQTLLSGNDEDVTDFYGYQNLSQSVTPLPNLSHKSQHRLGIVDGVGHVAKKMYESPVGLSALLDKVVLAGPRPPPMPDSGSGSGRNVAGGRHRHGELLVCYAGKIGSLGMPVLCSPFSPLFH